MADQIPKYQQIARALLDAPDPVYAIAHELAEQGERINAIATNVRQLEQRLLEEADLRKRGQ